MVNAEAYLSTGYRYLVFDFDGTLADSFGCFLQILNLAAVKHRFRCVQPQEVEHLRTYSIAQLLQHLGIPLWKVPLISAEMRRLMQQRIEQVPLFPQVRERLPELVERGITLGLVSSNSQANIAAVLGQPLLSLFSYLDCGAALSGKPARLQRMLWRQQWPAAQVLYIGDEVRDYQAAQAVGIDFRAVAWGYTAAAVLQQHLTQPLLQNWDELFALVE